MAGQRASRARVKPAMNRAGARAEDLCAQLLRRAGLRILARNWRCRHGEIDLVAEDGGTLVFAEVRLRRSERYGGAAESVTGAKRRRLLAAARLYLAGRKEVNCRFDVLLLDGAQEPAIQWIRDAFEE
jgi:putative endonuclease